MLHHLKLDKAESLVFRNTCLTRTSASYLGWPKTTLRACHGGDSWTWRKKRECSDQTFSALQTGFYCSKTAGRVSVCPPYFSSVSLLMYLRAGLIFDHVIVHLVLFCFTHLFQITGIQVVNTLLFFNLCLFCTIDTIRLRALVLIEERVNCIAHSAVCEVFHCSTEITHHINPVVENFNPDETTNFI